MTTFRIDLPWARPPLLVNQITNGKAHYAYKAKRDKALAEAIWSVRAARLPSIVGCDEAVFHYRPANLRSVPDSDGMALTLKVAIDALVLAGMLPADSWPHVVASGQRLHAPIKGEPGATWLTLHGVTTWDAA